MSGHPNYAGADAVAQVSLLGTVGTNAIVNVLHYELVGETTLATANTSLDVLLADWDTNIRPSFLGIMPTDYRLNLLRGTVVALPGAAHQANAPRERVPTTSAGTGGVASGDLSDACVVKIKTPLGGKSHRGRIYLLLAPGFVAGGVITNSGYLTGVAALNTALARHMPAGADYANARLGVWSRPLHAGEDQWTVRVAHVLTVKSNTTASGGVFTGATSLVTDTIVRSQRRRETGVGS